jgi:hypothetical protein
MNIPNLASSNQAGHGRLSSDSQFGSYLSFSAGPVVSLLCGEVFLLLTRRGLSALDSELCAAAAYCRAEQPDAATTRMQKPSPAITATPFILLPPFFPAAVTSFLLFLSASLADSFFQEQLDNGHGNVGLLHGQFDGQESFVLAFRGSLDDLHL